SRDLWGIGGANGHPTSQSLLTSQEELALPAAYMPLGAPENLDPLGIRPPPADLPPLRSDPSHAPAPRSGARHPATRRHRPAARCAAPRTPPPAHDVSPRR